MQVNLPCLNGSLCSVACGWAGKDVPTSPENCSKCLAQPKPMAKNVVTAALILDTYVNENGELDERVPDELMNDIVKYLPRGDGKIESEAYVLEGVGTELKNILSWFRFEDESKTCKCRQRALIMNKWGPDGCVKNMDKILDWLQESANDRGVYYNRLAVKAIVYAAIGVAKAKLAIGV